MTRSSSSRSSYVAPPPLASDSIAPLIIAHYTRGPCVIMPALRPIIPKIMLVLSSAYYSKIMPAYWAPAYPSVVQWVENLPRKQYNYICGRFLSSSSFSVVKDNYNIMFRLVVSKVYSVYVFSMVDLGPMHVLQL